MSTSAVKVFNEINADNSTIGIAGDWHGNSAWAERALEKLHDNGVQIVMHLGDFGVWPGPSGRKYLFWVNKVLKRYNMYLFVTLGNHEDYNQVARFDTLEGMEGCVSPASHENIVFFPRGFSWEWNNHKFMSFGGANSIDRNRRKPDKDWWHQEQITDRDVFNGINVGNTDVMFAHDVPYGIDVLGSHRSNLPIDVELYANESRKQLKRVTDVVKPSMYFHGHFHVHRNAMDTLRVNGEYEFYQMNTIGLDKEYTHYNTGILDTQNLQFNILHKELW